MKGWGSGPSPQGGEGEAAEGMEEGPRAREELGQSLPSLPRPAACTCVGKLLAPSHELFSASLLLWLRK